MDIYYVYEIICVAINISYKYYNPIYLLFLRYYPWVWYFQQFFVFSVISFLVEILYFPFMIIIFTIRIFKNLYYFLPWTVELFII